MKKIENAASIDELSKLYAAENKNVKDKVKFVELLGEKKQELMELLPVIKKEEYEIAIERLKKGDNLEKLLLTWKIPADIQEHLMLEATI